jgi:outer membrane protein TolC
LTSSAVFAALKDQALEEYLATEDARRSAQISLLSSVAQAYLSLAADRENIRLAAFYFGDTRGFLQINQETL